MYLYASKIRTGAAEDAEDLVAEIAQLAPIPLFDYSFARQRAYYFILKENQAAALEMLEPLKDKPDCESRAEFNAMMAYLLAAQGRTEEATPYREKVKQAPKKEQDLCFRLYPALASVLEMKSGSGV